MFFGVFFSSSFGVGVGGGGGGVTDSQKRFSYFAKKSSVLTALVLK